MSRAAGLLLVLGVLVVPCARTARAGAALAPDAEKTAEAFESLYGADVKHVQATRDAADDLAMAKRLLADAELAKDQPLLLALLCEKARELASAHAEGADTAVEAMDLLAAEVPGKAAACAEKAVDIRQKQFDAAKGDARPDAGEALVEALLTAADAKAAGGDLTGALALGRRAQTVARKVESDRREEIEALLKRLAADLRTQREIEALQALLEKDAANVAAREKLVRLYLVDLDAPEEAAKHLDGVADEDLKKHVAAAAGGAETAPEPACMELGDWYRGLGDGATAEAKAAMYVRAREYYARFLALYAGDDLKRTAAVLALGKVEAALEKAGGAAAARTAYGKGRWIDLLQRVDPAGDAVIGDWARQGAAIACAKPAPWARIMLATAPKGNYELEVRFARSAGDDMVGVVLPVGSAQVLVNLDGWRGAASGIERIDGKRANVNESTVRPAPLKNGREYTLAVQVLVGGDQAGISVDLDGAPCIAWRGACSRLSMLPEAALPRTECLGLAAYGSVVEFRSARLRMLSGRAKPLSPDAKPLAEAPTGPAKPGLWVDLLPLVDLAKDAATPALWTRTPAGLSVAPTGPAACLGLQGRPAGDYDVDVAFARQQGNPTIGVVLPVADADILFGVQCGGSAGLAMLKNQWLVGGNPTVVKAPELAPGRACVVSAQVRVKGDAAAVTVTLDGKPCVAWTGPLSDLRAPPDWVPPARGSLGLAARGGQVLFGAARLRVLSGGAKPAR